MIIRFNKFVLRFITFSFVTILFISNTTPAKPTAMVQPAIQKSTSDKTKTQEYKEKINEIKQFFLKKDINLNRYKINIKDFKLYLDEVYNGDINKYASVVTQQYHDDFEKAFVEFEHWYQCKSLKEALSKISINLSDYNIEPNNLLLYIIEYNNSNINNFLEMLKSEYDNDFELFYGMYEMFWSEYMEKLKKANEPIPSYETTLNTYTRSDFMGACTYTKYTSYDILNDIINTRGPLSDGNEGFWYQIFCLMGYNNESSVPDKVDCWVDKNGRITFILPNENIYISDGCYPVLVAYNLEDSAIKETFFYGNMDIKGLESYLAVSGPSNVREYIQRWREAEEKKVEAIEEWIDNWDYEIDW